MKKYFITFGTLLILLIIFMSYVTSKAVDELRVNYSKPDTTITVHNGKSDTLIIKKTVPSWLK